VDLKRKRGKRPKGIADVHFEADPLRAGFSWGMGNVIAAGKKRNT